MITKNKISLLMLLSFFLTIVSCNDDDTGPGNDQNLNDGFVEIAPGGNDSQTIVFGNSSTPESIDVPVFLNLTGLSNSSVDVDFNVVSVSGQDPSLLFNFPSGTTILAGERQGTITASVNEGANITEQMVFDVVLTGATGGGFQLGLPDNSRNLTHRVTVNPIFIATEYTGTSSLFDTDSNEFTATLTPVVGETDTFTIDTAWGDLIGVLTGNPALADVFPYPGILRFNREDLTFTIEGTDPRPNADFQPMDDGIPNTVAILPFESPLDQPGTIPGMDGTYDPVTNTLTFSLMQSLFAPDDVDTDDDGFTTLTFDTVSVTITAN